MKRLSKSIFWGALLFFALGYLLVFVTKAQTHSAPPCYVDDQRVEHGCTHFESHTDRRFALVNSAGAIVVIIYADDVTHNEGSGASGFYRGGNLIAWLRNSSGLSVKEMIAAQVPGKDKQ